MKLYNVSGAAKISGTKKAVSSTENGFFNLCAHLGSNQGPKDYESSTLTN
jgi:hypothetical protein